MWNNGPVMRHESTGGTFNTVRLQAYGFDQMFRLDFPPVPRGDPAFFGGVTAVSYDPSTGIFSGVGGPRRSGYALGPWAIAEVKENP